MGNGKWEGAFNIGTSFGGPAPVRQFRWLLGQPEAPQ